MNEPLAQVVVIVLVLEQPGRGSVPSYGLSCWGFGILCYLYTNVDMAVDKLAAIVRYQTVSNSAKLYEHNSDCSLRDTNSAFPGGWI
jgi:hypothetical protein